MADIKLPQYIYKTAIQQNMVISQVTSVCLMLSTEFIQSAHELWWIMLVVLRLKTGEVEHLKAVQICVKAQLNLRTLDE